MSKPVHDMFDSIAHRYDLANDVLSSGLHRSWRRTLLAKAGLQPGMRVLDLCTGTGEVARACAALVGPDGQVTGVDFVQAMLDLANRKPPLRANAAPIHYVQSDAATLPFQADTFNAALVAYGIRNVDDPVQTLTELHRVLQVGGRIAILEFGQPQNPIIATLFRLYSKYLMPRIGGLLTGNRAAYEYLPETSAAFPAGDTFLALMRDAGFRAPIYVPLLSGIAYVYVAEKL